MRYNRLTSLDAAFLVAETPSSPMHVGSLSIFEGEPLRDGRGQVRIDEIREVTEERLHLVPRLRQKVLEAPLGLGYPVWIDDPDFDVCYHVNLTTLPSPGTDEQLRHLCEHLHMQRLDRSRPLWEIWLVDGLTGGRVALIEKLHHCMVDGVSSVDVATATLDLTPEVTRLDAPAWVPGVAPHSFDLLVDGLREMLAEPVRTARSVAGRALHPGRTVARVRDLADAVSTFAAAPLAPPSSLNMTRRGRRRRLEAVHVALADVKEVGARLGGTVNDSVLAAVTGGLRAMLLARGDDVAGLTLHALVPVSTRPDDAHLALGNQVSTVFAPLPVGVADPADRFRSARDGMRRLKDHHQATVTSGVLDATGHLPAPVTSVLSRLVVHHQPFANVVVTNVPGPAFPLFLGGARMLETVPIVPLGGNLDVSIGVVSYDGDLCLGLYADADACPDVEVLAEGIDGAFTELRQVAGARRAAAPSRSARRQHPAPVARR